MKQKKNTIALLLSSSFLVLSGIGIVHAVNPNLIDEREYSSDTVADYAHPVFASDDEEEEEEEIVVDKVVLHYVNDDGDCARRAFYVWVAGVDGAEYSDEVNCDTHAVEYSADGQSMTITIDLLNDDYFKPLHGAPSIMYIIKYKMISPSNLNWGGQSEDVELRYDTFPPQAGSTTVEVWCTPAAGGGIAQFASEEETKVDGVKLAKFTDWKTISCTLTPTANEVEWNLYAFDESYYKVKPKNRDPIKKNYLVKTGKTTQSTFDIDLKYNAHINVVYSIVSKDTASTSGLEKTVFVSFEELYGTPRFEANYIYRGNDLGVTYSKNRTTFKVWSPVAANISLLVYESDTSAAYGGNDKYKGWHMVYQKNGVWELTLVGNLEGKYYNYQVDTWIGTNVAMDPYAKSAGACGVRGFIFDEAKSNPAGWESLPTKWDGESEAGLDIESPQELSIYEVHVQDFTGDESWVSNKGNERGTYNAFVERGTTLEADSSITTGFDHLMDLGVKAVQLLPVFDSDNDEVNNKKYNWGYNPLNYNCVEGVYSSNPHDGYARVREFKNLVYQFAASENRVRVIMDVVYNHVSSPSASCFNKLMPRYFFRYSKAGDYEVQQGWMQPGELHDGSGCHNEFKSEATMARKYIVDSVSMWARDYKIKGFRFDLMGLIDTGTMRAVKKALYQIDPDIYVYGEGWKADGWDHPFHGGLDAENNYEQTQGTFACGGVGYQVYEQLYQGPNDQECYLGGFNNAGRELLKGNNEFGQGAFWGWLQKGEDHYDGMREGLQKTLYGERSDDGGGNPAQTINYLSCHDNFTLRDQLYATLSNSGDRGAYGMDIIHATEAAHLFVFASNSAAFMLGGEEILRTKDLAFAPEESLEAIPATSYVKMYEGTTSEHLISHNSYNSPLEVNSFKWGNKLSVTFDGGEVIDTKAEDVTGKFAKMIKIHNDMPKYGYGRLQEIKSQTSAGRPVEGLSWKGGEYDSNAAIGIQFDEYFVFFGARNFGYVHCDTSGWTLLSGGGVGGIASYDGENKTVNLGSEGGFGLACAVYYRG